MKNKKGIIGFVISLLVLVGIIGIFISVQNVSYQHGTSRDVVQGYDKGIIWHHAYLKNDHATAYCFDDERFINILTDSQRTQKEVIITYEKYWGRGFFCSAAEKYETVIITKIEYA